MEPGNSSKKNLSRVYQSLLKFFPFCVFPVFPCVHGRQNAGVWCFVDSRLKIHVKRATAGRRSSLELQPGLPQLAQTDGGN